MVIGIDARLWYESGVGRYIRNLVNGFDKNESSSLKFIVFLNSKAFDEVSFTNPNIKKVKADIKWHTLSEQWKFKEIAEKENVDLMHFTYFSHPIFYNRPFVITIHDLIITNFPTGRASTLPYPLYAAKRIGYNIVLNHAARKAKKIITPTVTVKNLVAEKLKVLQDDIVVTYEGGLEKHKFKKKYSLHVEAVLKQLPKTFFLYVGNAYPHKNIKILIDAIQKIEDKNTSIVMVGKEDFFYKRLKNEIMVRNLNNRIIFLDKVDDDVLVNLYTHARALVVPSLQEGFGLPAVEALQLECLVVASDIPVHHEVLQNGVLYFDPQDSSDLVSKMEQVLHLTKEKREELEDHGFCIGNKYSWETMVKKTLEVYKSYLG
ncbi:MAG: hypothetical protein COX79_03000 [Candidatus Levybacteria bacterium CG_4_10_14_0_2_um_filter_36_16]|nr:MAG: hypothetical protein AUK12_00815 [Candidatus Levybacteria bacterium CG2_30_37_29]PIR79063.1 MAG: hypothetical protein COU26_03065 [Candidatus Levybacteria bacterium CG10_big_fil_rev_8_21_14_0_10_36_30]PIZ97205.1 MAG: hypothetical protein COX79_03000 [Candidatus Levybacteria bacterium CG_4_10_14_0_2_um_filter_36_16]PJA90609.1 MAG: hypothetical protein CO136_01545 [Candidatus Levybacteria bacterium CG_4_9_14_3_um_filter_36_7]